MEFFVGNLIVAGLSDWGCVLIPTGLPAELNPQMFILMPDDMGYYTSWWDACQRFFYKNLFSFFSGAVCPEAFDAAAFFPGCSAAEGRSITYPICRTGR